MIFYNQLFLYFLKSQNIVIIDVIKYIGTNYEKDTLWNS